MSSHNHPTPKTYQGVMVSSTFTDLEEHRAALIKIISRTGLKDVGMENDSAKPGVDVIDSSLNMVRDASAVIGVISQKYGQTPACPLRNPDGLSISELEFDEAQRLNRHILLFVMGDEHPGKRSDFEFDSEKLAKLDAFRERAKLMGSDSQVQRVYAMFSSLEEFKEKAAQAVAELSRFLDEQCTASGNTPLGRDATGASADPIPLPPAFYAEPPYIGSHEFSGRREQLATLDEWAQPSDTHPLLLFEAIGGSGKSMVTWEWSRRRAPRVRADWAGIFWYSFYERGAVMADFCRHALAYMSATPLSAWQGKKTAELAPQLLLCLQDQPWLLILDGLERVLVAYHRIDAAQLRDEDAGQSDAIARRDPCAAIRPEDDELVRVLAGAAPSKLLLTSRLIPRVLLNPSGQPIPGVLHQRLPGLRAEDAEALFRVCGVAGEGATIRDYLKRHCDCHPLTVGVLAGLVTHYLPARGDFDRWSAAPEGGGKLDFAKLDLVQKRNHIFAVSLADLPADSRRLLAMIALLSEAVDYSTLLALNPHLPTDIPVPWDPIKPEDDWELGENMKAVMSQAYETDLLNLADYRQAAAARLCSPEYLAAPQRLDEAIKYLEKRGLLQYDRQAGHYDLHPVVRGVASSGLAKQDTRSLGQRVVDHFSARPHDPYQRAETLNDLRDGLHVVRTLLRMGEFQKAYDAYAGDLAHALSFNLEAHAETVALLRPFFSKGWGIPPTRVDANGTIVLATDAANALGHLGQTDEQIDANACAISAFWESEDWDNFPLQNILSNMSEAWLKRNRLAKADICLAYAMDCTEWFAGGDAFCARLGQFKQLSRLGRRAEADFVWKVLDPKRHFGGRSICRPGNAECSYAEDRFRIGDLTEEHLVEAERLAHNERNRQGIRYLHGLRGRWRLERGEWVLAAASLQEAVALARAAGLRDGEAETQFALAQYHLGQLGEPRHTAELLAQLPQRDDLTLAVLWHTIGDIEQARRHALAAYRWAWSDGEPFVWRHELDKASELLARLGAEIPDLSPYNPANDQIEPWEIDVQDIFEELRAEEAAE